MSNIAKRNLKLISVNIKNIEGMSTKLQFKSNLIVIYGYNRTGKTILIKCLRYAFQGFRKCGADLEKLIGDGTNGQIELLFEFKGILYKIIREVTESSESIRFLKSKIPYSDIKNLPAPKKRIIWSKINSEELIPKTSIKTRGDSTTIFSETLSELKLYPDIIDRLIALDNNQEFKNATESFGSKEGGGYENIKNLLYRDLKDKDDAIKDIIKHSDGTLKKLENQSFYINQDYQEFISEIKEVVNSKEIDIDNKNTLNNLIKTLKIEPTYNENLIEFKTALNTKQGDLENWKQKAEKLENLIPNKENNYEELRKLLESTKLKKLERTVESFIEDRKALEELQKRMAQIYRNIEDNPTKDTLKAISLDFSYLISEEVKKLLIIESLEEIVERDGLIAIPSLINQVIENFNDALKIFSRNKEILKKHKVDPKLITDILQNYRFQLEKIESPIIFEKNDKIYKLYGRVEEDEFSNKKNLNIYMQLEDLKEYVNEKEPLSIQQHLSPVKKSKAEAISKQIIKELSTEISEIIKDLEELQEIQSKLEPFKTSLNKSLDSFNEIISTLSLTGDVVSNWAEYITSQKSLAREFINKNLDVNTKIKADFDQLKESLLEIEKKYIELLKKDFTSIEQDYDVEASLNDNLMFLSEYISDFIGNCSNTIEIIKNLMNIILDKQEDYRTLCRNKELNEVLKNTIIPSIQIICSQIQGNIQLDKIEKKVMNDIKKHAEHFYHNITREGFLVLEKLSKNGRLFLKPYLKKSGGKKIEIMDSGPSGSEQASIAIGIMVALANIFNGFVVIDEVTDRFDGPTKPRFFRAIQNFSDKLFWIIVVKIDSSSKDVYTEFKQIRDYFPKADIFQTTKDGSQLTTSVHKIRSYEDLIIQED